MTKSSPCLAQRPARRTDRSDARMPERSNLRFPTAFASLLFFFRSPDFFLRGRARLKFHRPGSGVAVLLYLFEDYVLDTGTRELRRDDAPVAIEPKVFDL